MEKKMAKTKRVNIGSVVKSKESGKPDYIKIKEDVTLRKGEFINLESKSFQLERLEAVVAEGKLSEEKAEAARERINKIPDFVRFEMIKTVKLED
jgi:hypothetical protein